MPAATTEREQLTARTWKGAQSVNFEGLWDVNGEKVRVRIKRDFYDFQSFATAELFDPERRQWNRVAALPFAHMASLALSSQRLPSSDEDEFEVTFYTDQAELLNMVALILDAER